MKLAADALQPAIPPRQQLISLLLAEIHVEPRQFLPFKPSGEYIEQLTGSLYVAQQATAGDRSERHCTKQLGVVGDAGPLAGIRPRPIEHVLAVRMKLAIQRQGCLQRALRVAQQAMGRLPATAPSDTAAVLQR